MKRNFLLPSIALWLLATICLKGQSPYTTYRVTGDLQDETEQPIAYANAVVYRSSDTTIVKMNYSEDDGHFDIAIDEPGNYFLEITYVGLEDFRSPTFDLNSVNQTQAFSTITLSARGETLEEVVVTARKPLLEVKPDKMVVNVAGSINAAGNNALELLRKSPGVMVDQNDNISLMGKAGIQIYINGKKSPLTGDQLANYLKSLPSEDIENIELITQPSAKYDAEGNAGIINIVLRKNQNEGYNANVALSYSRGEKSNYNGSINTNYKSGKTNVFGSLSYYNNEYPNTQVIYRTQNGMVFDQDLRSLSLSDGLNYRVGMDYQLSTRSTLGAMVNGNRNTWDWAKESRAQILSEGSDQVDSILWSDGGNRTENTNTNYNINYQWKGDNDRSLNVDADYGYFGRQNEQNQPNVYTDATGDEILHRKDHFIQAPSRIDIYTAKTDYEQAFCSGMMSMGLKWSKVLTDNTFNFFDVLDDQKIKNMDRSNDFTYDEQVFASYVHVNQKIGKWGFQSGIRVEHSRTRGLLESQMDTELDDVKRNYTDVFPSMGVTYEVNDKNSVQLSYSRRINRPNYSSLNPFEFQLDELTYEKGNPFLTPEYTQKLQLNHIWNHSITTSLGYSHTRDMITQIIEVEEGNAAFQTHQNLTSQKDLSASISGSVPIADWWSAFSNVMYYYRESVGNVNKGEEASLHLNSVTLYSQHTFSLPGKFSLEVDGYYNTPTLWGGQFVSAAQWAVNVGVQKKLFQDKATVKLAFSDLFDSQGWESRSEVGDFYLFSKGTWDSQRIRLSFSYSLGNTKIKTRQRSSGLEDEKSRVGE